jgi:hypothetical protein
MLALSSNRFGAGRQMSALEIGHLIGSDKDPERWSELKVNVAKQQDSRPS